MVPLGSGPDNNGPHDAANLNAALSMTRPEKPQAAHLRHIAWRSAITGAFAITASLAVMSAFGIAPQSSFDVDQLSVVEPAVELPVAALPHTSDDVFLFSETVRRGDTLGNVLLRAGVDGDAVSRVLGDAEARKRLSQLRPGQALEVGVDHDGGLRHIRFRSSSEQQVRVEANDDGLQTRLEDLPIKVSTRFASGEIRSSLFGATDDAGIPDSVAVQIAEIFSGVVDFHRGLRRGDRFWVVYEQRSSAGEPLQAGRVLAAEFRNGGTTHVAYWFATAGERGGYYTADGKSLRRQFLLSPLEFSRVSSGFTNARYHPVLKEWRAHRGIDYAAPIGTRVRATAEGVVDFAGTQGGYGNIVIVRHHGGYSTAYAHLSRFAPGLRKGSRIGQGDTLGFVGMTGLASGPHLHYEFRVNGQQVDPQRAKLPDAPPLAGETRRAFERQREAAARQIELARQTVVARFE